MFMIKKIKRSLAIKIAVPVVTLVLVLGGALYLLVLTTISDFMKKEIERDLGSLSHRIYNICNSNFDEMLHSGLAGDTDTLIIKQATTLGQFEDFFRHEGLDGVVYDMQKKEFLLQTIPETHAAEIIKGREQKGPIGSLNKETNGYFYWHFDFSPWHWHIIIIKSEEGYHGLISKVRFVHQYTLGLLILAAILLVFMIYGSIRKPIDAIIEPLQKNKPPEYKGIDVFEYLSNVISGMMDSLQQSEEKYRSLVETTSDFVWEVDESGAYTYASPAIREILGYEPEEMIGLKIFDFAPSDKKKEAKEKFAEFAKFEKSFERLENETCHKNGSRVVLETSGVPVIDSNGRVSGYRGIGRDITERLRIEEERKKLENHIVQFQKLKAFEKMAGGIAHDFNNLLSIILGSLTLAGDECGGNISKYLRKAEEASFRARDLTSQLITFSGIGAPATIPGSIGELARETANSILSDMKVQCEYVLPDNLWPVKFDKFQMKRAIENVIANAVESMPDGGRIRISAENVEFETEKNITTVPVPVPMGKYVKLTIKDRGVGISGEHLAHVFDPYFSTKELGARKGMGLGLATTYSIINRHGGFISAESEIGKGTGIIILLPAHSGKTDSTKNIIT